MAKIVLTKDTQGYNVGDYVPLNNTWGKGSLVNGDDFTQSITFNEGTLNGGVTFDWSWPTGGVKVVAYPEIAWGDSPFYNGIEECRTYVSKVSDLTAFEVDLEMRAAAGSKYLNVAFDMWLTDKPLGNAASITTEVMVWLDKTAAPWGTKVATFGTGSEKASVYVVNDVKAGTRVWDYIAVVYDKPHLTGEVDIKGILDELAQRGLIDDDDYISGYHLGVEVTGGSGSLNIDKLETTFTSDPTSSNDKMLTGTLNNDTLKGGKGNDTLEGAAGGDVLNGGEGNDTLSYRSSNAAVNVDLSANKVSGGHATGDVVSNFENVTGSAYNDVLHGSAGNNVIQGLDGNDVIDGKAGDDILYGGAGGDSLVGGDGRDTIFGDNGNDRITGGSGADNLSGGAGADWFVYKAGDSTLAGADTIFDFNFKEGDRLDFVNIDGDTVTRGYQRFDFIGTKQFTGDAGEIRYEKTETQTYIYADTDGNKIADIQIVLDQKIDVSSNFFVI